MSPKAKYVKIIVQSDANGNLSGYRVAGDYEAAGTRYLLLERPEQAIPVRKTKPKPANTPKPAEAKAVPA